MCIRGLGFCPQFYSSLKILRLFKSIYTWPQLHSLPGQHKVDVPRVPAPQYGPQQGARHHKHTPPPPHPGHQLFSIIASQWIKLINIQTRWLLHPIFCCVCECVRSSSLDIGFVHIISTCYTVVVCCIVSCSSLQFVLLVEEATSAETESLCQVIVRYTYIKIDNRWQWKIIFAYIS